MATRSSGMLTFVLVWVGQVVSFLGTGMTRFALTIWAWQVTGEATALALVGVFSAVPALLFSPIAGALVDRWNRKLVMMLSDLAAGVSTIVVLLLFASDSLQIWHLYVAAAFTGVFEAFQFPAYTASITTLLPKEHYTRASGMMTLAEYASLIAAPLLGGMLLGIIGIAGIMLIDIITFVFAVLVLLLVFIPQPARPETESNQQSSLWQEIVFGVRYIVVRPSLVGLLAVSFAFNTSESLSYHLIAPMILARTGNDSLILGSVQAVLGIGGVFGSVMISIWGGPKRRIHGVLIGLFLTGLLGDMLMGVGRDLAGWMIAAFCLEFFIPLATGANQAIWQAKIPPEIQGRVFATRRTLTQIAGPITSIIGARLVDTIFEPALMPGGSFVPLFGGLVGTGPGAGMGLDGLRRDSQCLCWLIGLSLPGDTQGRNQPARS
jgi:MFS transporter, DHA3 family, macrolide efflux protein